MVPLVCAADPVPNPRGSKRRHISEKMYSVHSPLILSSVAINLIVQHIQDILNGDICKWQRGSLNSHARGLKRAMSEQGELANGIPNPPGKRALLEPSSRPH